MSLERVCHELDFIVSLQAHTYNLGDQKFLEKSSLIFRYEKGMSLD
jgi:hypothetical protein